MKKNVSDKQCALLTESLRSGVTELLILQLLTKSDAYGYDIYKQIDEQTNGAVSFFHTATYTYLRRMKEKGLIAESDYCPEEPTSARRTVYYTITEEGKAYLAYGKKQFQAIYGQAKKLLS